MFERPDPRSLRRRTVATTFATLAVGGYAYAMAKFRHEATTGFTLDDPPAVGDPAFGRLVESLTSAPVRHGNRVEVLRNGCRFFPAMLEAIRAAERTIDFSTYVYWTGEIAEEFAAALSERARAGVDVNILLDAIGAAQMDRALVTEMEEAGATVVWFRPPHWHDLNKLDNRTHRKILVVDGRVGFTGGAGVAEEWTGDCEDPDHWRDTHVRVEGPVVRDLVGGFQDNWSEATGTILTGDHLPHLEPHPDGVPAQVTRSAAGHGATDAEELFHAAIASARDRLWITSAYFAPRGAFVDDLIAAAARGVDVRVLVNGPNGDKEVVRQTGRRSYERLLGGGVRIFEYQPTMLHAKIVTVDGVWSTTGSINLDNRSFTLNDELNLSLTDATVAAAFDADFERDLEDSRELDASRWSGRSMPQRFRETVAATLRPKL